MGFILTGLILSIMLGYVLAYVSNSRVSPYDYNSSIGTINCVICVLGQTIGASKMHLTLPPTGGLGCWLF